MLERVLEPEVMDEAGEADEYDRMDHATVNRNFVTDLLAVLATRPHSGRPLVLDIGTGTARIPILLCQQTADVDVVGDDLSPAMLSIGETNIAEAGLSDRVRCRLSDGKSLPDAEATYDVVMSNTVVHHIPEPAAVLAEMWRVLRPGGILFVRDLFRPATNGEVERLVGLHAAGESESSRQLLRQSLHAALTRAEIEQVAARVGLQKVQVRETSDRHWTLIAEKV